MNWRNLLIFPFVMMATSASPSFAETVDINGVPIHYEVMGEGEPVVLLHGLMVDWQSNFGELAVDLSKEFKVIGIDLRGHGKSGKPASTEGYGPAYVGDVLAVMDAVDAESAHVIGYSLGGYIALKLAASHPERVRSLILGGSGYQSREWYLQSGAAIRERFAAADTVASGFVENPEELPEGFRELFNRNDKQTMITALTGIEALAVNENDLEQLGMPILGIFGGKDYGVPNMLAPIQVAQPDMSIVLIPDATHLTAIETKRMNSGIAAFLSEQAD